MVKNIIIPELTFLVLFITLVVLWFYTVATQNIARSTDEANTFNAVTRIHERMANIESYRRRGYLHAEFDEHFKKANQDFNALPSPDQTVEKYYEILAQQSSSIINLNAREAVEMTLNDFDIIVLPYFLKIKAAKKVASAYEDVLIKTGEHIVPFVKLQQELRKDKTYKLDYLNLLEELGKCSKMRTLD